MGEIEKSSLRALFWKDEILQILYWMNGEGFGDEVPFGQVLSLLNTNEANLEYHISKLVREGVLLASSEEIVSGTKIRLATEMKKEAGRRIGGC